MACRRGARSAAQHILAAHELGVVLGDGAGGGPETRVRAVVAASPFPHVAESLREHSIGRSLAQRERMQGAAFEEISGAWRAAISHSASVGNRAFAQRANASASKKLTWQTGVLGSTGTSPWRVKVCHWLSRCVQYSGACHRRAATASHPAESHSSGRR